MAYNSSWPYCYNLAEEWYKWQSLPFAFSFWLVRRDAVKSKPELVKSFIQYLKDSRELGGVFESMIFLHLSALCQRLVPRPRLFYWRTAAGKEVDFVIEWGRKLLAVEVMLSRTPRFSDTGGLRLFLEEYPETSAGVLIHSGNEVRRLHDKIVAIPWFILAGL